MAQTPQESTVFVHPTAVIDSGARIGGGCKIWHFCHIMGGAEIGSGSMLGQNVFVATGAVIGRGVRIQNNVSVYDGVVIQDDAFVGPSVVFTNVNTPRSFVSRKSDFRQTIIQTGASIGANATVLPGVSVGRYALVGAGAVVTRDVPDHCLVYGNPARPRGWVCTCGAVLQFKQGVAMCGECQARFRRVEDRVEALPEK